VIGSVVDVIQVGRLPSGEPAAVLRATQRARIGQGVTGTGAALWVEAELLDEPASSAKTREAAAEFKQVLTSILQQRNAWQVLDAVQRMSEPAELSDVAGYASWIEPADKVRLLEMLDPAGTSRLPARARAGLPGRAVRHGQDPRGRPGGHGEDPARVSAAPAAGRDPQGAGRGPTPGGGGDYRSRIEAADLPEKVREAALAEADRLERSSDQSRRAAGSGPGWTPCSTCPGPSARWTPPTSSTLARCWTPTTPASDDVKERIVEHLAVRARRAKRGPRGRRRPGSGAVLAPGRSARGGQDLAR
jgi:ATP-dependent Lon protease